MALTTQSVITSLMEKFGNGDGDIVGLSQDELVRAFQQVDTKPKSRKTRKAKDPNAPKRVASTYMMWLNDHRDQIRDEHCADLEGRDRTTGISKKAGELWKALSDDDKAPYITRYAEAKAKYDEEMAVYAPDSVKPSGPKYDAADYPEAPEGWTGPYLHAYLKKNVTGDDGKNLKFKSFEEAVAHANTLDSDVCAGITKASRSYQLRVGPNIIRQTSYQPSGLGVWVRGEPTFDGDSFDINVDHLASNDSNEQPCVSTPEPEEAVSAPAEPEPEPEVEVELRRSKRKFKAPKKDDSAEKAAAEKAAAEKAAAEKAAAEKAAAEKAEAERIAAEKAEADNADDETDDECEAEDITIDGDSYFLTEDGGIYTPEGDRVGQKPDDADDDAEPCADWLD